jgi:hypothetical protein
VAFGRNRETTAAGPERGRLQTAESALARFAMTLGIIGIGTAVAAILGTQEIDAWIIGLVVSILAAALASIVWAAARPRV